MNKDYRIYAELGASSLKALKSFCDTRSLKSVNQMIAPIVDVTSIPIGTGINTKLYPNPIEATVIDFIIQLDGIVYLVLDCPLLKYKHSYWKSIFSNATAFEFKLPLCAAPTKPLDKSDVLTLPPLQFIGEINMCLSAIRTPTYFSTKYAN